MFRKTFLFLVLVLMLTTSLFGEVKWNEFQSFGYARLNKDVSGWYYDAGLAFEIASFGSFDFVSPLKFSYYEFDSDFNGAEMFDWQGGLMAKYNRTLDDSNLYFYAGGATFTWYQNELGLGTNVGAGIDFRVSSKVLVGADVNYLFLLNDSDLFDGRLDAGILLKVLFK